MEKPVVVASFSFPHEAQIARASLEAAGIPAHLADEHTINMQWLYSNALGGVKVLVAPEHAQDAKNILAADFSADVDKELKAGGVVCPSCDSTSVEPHTQGKKSAFLVFLMLGFPLFFCKHGMKCGNCGDFWET